MSQRVHGGGDTPPSPWIAERGGSSFHPGRSTAVSKGRGLELEQGTESIHPGCALVISVKAEGGHRQPRRLIIRHHIADSRAKRANLKG